MNSAVQAAISTLERELAAIDQQREQIQDAIAALRRADSQAARHARRRRRASGMIGKRAVTKMGRPSKGSRQQDHSNEADGQRISNALKTAGGALSPRALANQLKLTVAVLRRRLQPLVKIGAVKVTGGPRNRLISLSGSKSAKEEP